jgi:hypothetical protein
MGSEMKNKEGWKNWGDHPLFVLLSSIGVILGIVGTIYTILSFYKSDKPPVEENTYTTSKPDSNFPGKNVSEDLAFGIYIDEKIAGDGNFFKKFETVIRELKPKKISVINLRWHKQAVWAATPEDFYFDWNEGYFFSSENSPKVVIKKMFTYMATGFDSSKCVSIYDLKRRIAKDKYQKNILITNNVFSCGDDENAKLDLPSDKKVLVLLVAKSSDNSTWFYYAEETLKKIFPTGEVSPFVSIMEQQLIDFLQAQ